MEGIRGDPCSESATRRTPRWRGRPHAVRRRHLRLTQSDILDYVIDPDYVEPEWPAGYWPDRNATATRAEFDATNRAFIADKAALRTLVLDPQRDLFAVIPGTPGHTLLREVRVDADHNAYHVGEFAILRQIMGTWPPGHE